MLLEAVRPSVPADRTFTVDDTTNRPLPEGEEDPSKQEEEKDEEKKSTNKEI